MSTIRPTATWLGHRLLDVVDLHRHEGGEILVAILRDEDHVFETDAEMFLRQPHRRFGGEDHPPFKRRRRRTDIVYFHPHRVPERRDGLPAPEAVHESLCG